MRRTQRAHRLLGDALADGDIAIDGTAGNGHDTVFLAQRVGARGHVYAFDLQTAALQATQRLLRETDPKLTGSVTLIQACHSKLQEYVPPQLRQRVACAMFNLGYLPGADHAIKTRAKSTAAAIDSAIAMLRPGGLITVVGYPAHDGGDVEVADLVERVVDATDRRASWRELDARSRSDNAPRLFVARKA